MSVRFILDVRVKPGMREQLLGAYSTLRDRVAREPGLISHQLCEAIDDPDRWVITSEWESQEASSDWDQSDVHRQLIGPVRACFSEARSTKFDVRHGSQR